MLVLAGRTTLPQVSLQLRVRGGPDALQVPQHTGQHNGKSQSLTRVHDPCGQGSQTHQVRTWSQRKKGRSAISPSQGTAPVGSSWTSDAAGCGVPCGVTARRAPFSLDDQNSQGEWTQVILLSFYSETMWKLPACGRRRDRSPPAPCEFSPSPGLSCHSLTFSRWPEVGPGLWAPGSEVPENLW